MLKELTPEQRRAIVDEAISCLRTPYHAHAKLKGAGFDCATFLLHVYQATGHVPLDFKVGHYSIQVHLHRADTQYIEIIEGFAAEIKENEALPGDIVMFKVAHGFHHGAVIVNWPEQIIHAKMGQGISYSHGTNECFTRRRDKKFYRLKNVDTI